MNANRRKQLDEIGDEIALLLCKLETLRDEEQEYLDNMPESLQQGEKGEKAQGAIDEIENAISNMEETLDALALATH